MKKLFLSLAVVFSVAMVSCGGNKEKEEADTTPVEVAEVAVVEATVDTAAPAGDSIVNVDAAGVEEAAPAEAPAN